MKAGTNAGALTYLQSEDHASAWDAFISEMLNPSSNAHREALNNKMEKAHTSLLQFARNGTHGDYDEPGYERYVQPFCKPQMKLLGFGLWKGFADVVGLLYTTLPYIRSQTWASSNSGYTSSEDCDYDYPYAHPLSNVSVLCSLCAHEKTRFRE